MPIPATGGQFGGYLNNPNWGGSMPNGNSNTWARRPSALVRGGYHEGPTDPRAFGQWYRNADEKQFWYNEIGRLEEQLNRLRRLPPSDRVYDMMEQIRQELKDARLNFSRAGGGTGDGATAAGAGFGGIDLSQSMGQDQGESRSIDDFFNLLDRFQRRFGGGSLKYGGGELPAEWNPEDAAVPGSSVDPMAVIKSAKPRLQEEMNRAFGSAAQRLGAAGVPLSSSAYTKELGKGARKASADLGELTMNTLFQAGENQAQREAAARQAALDRSLSAWGTRGGWEFERGRDLRAEWQNQLPMFLQLMQTVSPNTRWRW